MAATVEITESNESGGEVLTVAVKGDYGAADLPNLTPATYPLPPSTNSYEKAHRLRVVDLGGSAAVAALKLWATPPGNATGLSHYHNGHGVQATYDASKRTTYAAPVATTGNTPNAVPTSEPASANCGIGGSLTGSLTAPGRSDYLLHQVRVGPDPKHTDALPVVYTLFYGYTETI